MCSSGKVLQGETNTMSAEQQLEKAAVEIERLNIRIRQDAEAAFQYLNEIDRLKELVAALREEKEKLYKNVAEREAEIKRTSRDPGGKVLHDETPR
jgi:hypothetical protein